jgi:ABC-type transport system involved in cytochrome c biogenesis permease component
MTFLPIVARELRVASRRRATYWLRTGAALWPIGIGTWFFLVVQHQPVQQISQGLFALLTGSATLYCLISGLRATADCLSEEKREGTLGLLFLTDLKGYDVVLGKLAATSLGTFYAVLAVVPTLAVPLLMGGITAAEFSRMGLVALNTMFFSLCTGIFASSLVRSNRQANLTALLLMIIFFALLPACGALLDYYQKTAGIKPVFLLSSPGYTYVLAFDASSRRWPRQFWWSLGTVHCVGWGFLILASLIAPHTWQDRPRGVRALKWREQWRMWSFGDSTARAQFRARLLDRNSFFWLMARARAKPAVVWAALALVGCVWAWGLLKYEREWLNHGAYLLTGACLNVLIKAWFATEASRQLAEDRQRGALELLLSTPLSTRDILEGHALALRRQFLGPVLLVLGLFAVFLVAGLRAIYEHNLWIWLWIAGMVMLVVDLVALYWVGMWQGLTAKSAQRAGSSTLAQILTVPWVGMALGMLALSLLLIHAHFEPSEYFFLFLWVCLGVVADIAFGGYARYKLLTNFREAAASAPKGGLFGALLGRAGSQDSAASPDTRQRL